MEGTYTQLSALLAAWTGDVEAQPFAHEDAVRAFGARWACRQRYLAGVRRVTDTVKQPPA